MNVCGEYNDLTTVKIGYDLVGVDYVNDGDGIFKNALEHVYHNLLSQNVITSYSLIDVYEQKYLKNVSVDYNCNLDSFLIQMRQRKIKGTELIIIFMKLERIGYFGKIKYSMVFRKLDDDYMERLLIFEVDSRLIYFRTSTQEFIETTRKELNDLFNQNVLFYEDEKYTLEGIGFVR